MLLQTKLFIPPLRSGLVTRPRLIKRLDEAMSQGHRLTLVAAPAGFGKTTLLAEWIANAQIADLDVTPLSPPHSAVSPSSVCWLSLDPGDNDPIRFWTYLVAALQTVQPDVGRTALAMLQTPQPAPVDAILTDLMNEIAPRSIPLVLVLDDYHLIEMPVIHQGIAFLLDHLPPQLHLILLTRADPPLPLARLRARGQMVEIRAADLRFTTDEVAAFLQQAMGLDLAACDIAALEARTEGWIAGLQLAGLSMQSGGNARDFVSAFTGTHHYVVDYLVQEVLDRQPVNARAFLLKTSILDRLSGPLCDALTGRTDGQSALDRLARANLFVVPLDDARHWYRYHRLFADMLRYRLSQALPEQAGDLHRRAASWFDQNGLFDLALTHWTQAQEWGQAAQMIERRGTEMLALGEMTTLRRWVDMLPIELVHSRPWLCILYAWALLLGLDLEKSKAWIECAQECLSAQAYSAQADEIAGHIAAIQAYLAGMEQDDRRAHAFCRQALDRLPQSSTFLRGLIAYLFGMINLRSGDLDGARPAIEEASRMCQASGVLHVAILAVTALGAIHSLQGNLHLAYETYQSALRLAAPSGKRPLPVAAVASNYLAGLMYEWNDLEAAERYLAQGAEQGRQWGSTEDVINNSVTRARMCRARDDLDGVRGVIEQMKAAVPASELHVGQIVTTQIRYQLDRGELGAAEQLARQSGIGQETNPNLNNLSEWAMHCTSLWARSKSTSATSLARWASKTAPNVPPVHESWI